MKNSILKQILNGISKVESFSGKGSQQQKQEQISYLFNQYGDDLLNTLMVAFDTFTQTHIKHTEPIKNNNVCGDFDDIVAKIISVKALNKELRNTVNEFVGNICFTELESSVLNKILTKSLNIGIGIKSINKALGYKFLTDIEVMKAEDEISIVKGWFDSNKDVYAEVKYDGIRCFSVIENGCVQNMFTYNLSELNIEKCQNTVNQLQELAKHIPYKKFFFDFEITGVNRQSVGGEVNKLIQDTAKNGCDDNWVYNIFDVVEYGVFDGVESEIYTSRRTLLKKAFNNLKFNNLKISECYQVHSIYEVNKLFCSMLERGEEGIMLKLGSGIYELKRSKLWVKMKAVLECDLKVTAVFDGEKGTKREKTIGGFTCESSCGCLKVDVGSGFKDELLNLITKDKHSYIGKIVEIKFNSVITDKNGENHSLFLPRLLRIREPWDKNVANSLDEILKKH